MRFRLLIVLSCASLVFLAGACSGPKSARSQVLRIGNGAEPEGLDPHTVTGIPEHHILLCLMEGLVRLNPEDLAIVPGVAERWEESADGLEYTFHLRNDATWSNGDPLTAKDFAYAWRRILTPSLASEYAYMLFPMKNAQAFNEGKISDFSQVGCEVTDDYTVKVVLEKPTPFFMQLHAHYSWFPLQQATIEKFGEMDDRNSQWTRAGNFVGNGPYVLAKWVPNSVIAVTPNPHYWNASGVKNAGVEFYPVSSDLTEERMFRAGELDITENVPVSKVPVYQKEDPEVLRIDDWIGSYFYRVNTTRKPLNDVRVRKALAMAMDRDALVSRVLQSGEKPAPYLTPAGIGGYVPSAGVKYDVEGARRLLAEAGYPNGDGCPTIDILYNTLEKHKIIAEAIQQMWKENLHINVTLTNQDWKVYLDATSNESLDYDLARAGWIGDVVDPINFLECFITGNGNNRTGWGSAEYDRLLDESARTKDHDARNKLFDRAETILVDELPIIPIFHYTRPFLIQRYVKDFHPNILGYYAFHLVSIERGSS